ncbi:MAG TPA: hypothetical protein VJ692_14755, partial [Nitrospiraceae bacterium]|nr:hypothetical protein [Nitrospiraceae bacterium]
YRNTDGTVEIEGVPQMTVTLKKPDGPLLINFVMFDATGRLVTKVIDSTMAFNERRAHDLERTPTKLLLKQADSNTIVLQAEVKDNGRVVVNHAQFLTIKGHRMEITPTEWRVEKIKKSKDDQDRKGGAVVLG